MKLSLPYPKSWQRIHKFKYKTSNPVLQPLRHRPTSTAGPAGPPGLAQSRLYLERYTAAAVASRAVSRHAARSQAPGHLSCRHPRGPCKHWARERYLLCGIAPQPHHVRDVGVYLCPVTATFYPLQHLQAAQKHPAVQCTRRDGDLYGTSTGSEDRMLGPDRAQAAWLPGGAAIT